MLCFVPHDSLLVVRASGFSSRRDIVLNLLQKRNSYKLIQVLYTSTHLKTYLFVILPFDSAHAQGERSTPLYGLYGYVQPQRVYKGFFKTFWSEIEHRFWSFQSQTGNRFLHFSLELGMFSVVFRRSFFFYHYR